jgi:hypothetical protein
MAWNTRRVLVGGAAVIVTGAVLGLVHFKEEVPAMPTLPPIPPLANSFAEYASLPVGRPLDLVFLHHSIGEHWLADPPGGSDASRAHENGGGLRRALVDQGYRVHEATYGSRLGEDTDLFDWLPKFGGHMDEVLRIAHQDAVLPEGGRNKIVLFKSCFPNSYFRAEGSEPGNPKGPELTVANAKATFRELLTVFARSPDTLFVFVTTPPVVNAGIRERLGKVLVKRLLGHPLAAEKAVQQARLARQFHDWIVAPDGWLASYPSKNVVVFDYYAVLSKQGRSLFSEYPSGGGADNHPSTLGNQAATAELVPFLNRAVRRAGIAD